MPLAGAGATERSVARFLEEVHARVVPLGVREHLDVRALLRGGAARSHTDLRAALAAMLARNEDELEAIGKLFDDHYPLAVSDPGRPREGVRPGPVTPVKGPPSHPGPARRGLFDSWPARRVLAAVLAAMAVTSVIFVAILVRPDGPVPPPLPAEQDAQVPDAPEDAPPPPPLEPEDGGLRVVEAARTVTYTTPELYRPIDARDYGAFLGAWVVLYLGLRWWLLPRASAERQKAQVNARRKQANEERRRMAQQLAESGEPLHLAYDVPPHPAIQTAALDDAANLLGRLFRRERSEHLDVGRTIRETVREGGRFMPVFEPGRGARDIVVLVNVERGDHPWLGGVMRALDHLQRANVALIRFTFSYAPAWLDPGHGSPLVSIRELSRHFGGAALVIVSRSLLPRVREEDAAWLDELGAFPVKAWIDPDPRPLHQRGALARAAEAIERCGLTRFPWTEEGVRALAVYLAREGDAAPRAPWKELPSLVDARVAEAVEAWALCAALVPDATWDQLEAIRRHPDFREIGDVLPQPAALQCLLDWVTRETGTDPESGNGRTLELPPALVDRLVREHRRRCLGAPRAQSLEARAHRLLLKQLRGTRPNDPLQQLHWELKVAAHRMVLAPERTRALMESFLGTAVEEEAAAVLDAELRRQDEGYPLGRRRVPEADRERLRLLAGEAAFVPLRELFWGHRGVTLNALGGATVIIVALALSLNVILKFDRAQSFLLGLGGRRIEAELPATYKKVTPADGSQGDVQ